MDPKQIQITTDSVFQNDNSRIGVLFFNFFIVTEQSNKSRHLLNVSEETLRWLQQGGALSAGGPL